MKNTLRGAFAALLMAAALGGTIAAPANAQRDRYDQYDRDNRYDRYDRSDRNDRNDRYDRDGRYGNSRLSRDSIRRLADRAESTSNQFREVYERYERDRDSYDRDYRGDRYSRDDRNRDDRYRDDRYRNDRTYRRDDRRGGYNSSRSFSDVKPYVQRMDEGLERLRGQTDDSRGLSESRTTLSEILRNARIVDRSLGNRSSGYYYGRGNNNGRRDESGDLYGLWSRVRSDLNALASAYGLQRI